MKLLTTVREQVVALIEENTTLRESLAQALQEKSLVCDTLSYLENELRAVRERNALLESAILQAGDTQAGVTRERSVDPLERDRIKGSVDALLSSLAALEKELL